VEKKALASYHPSNSTNN